MRKPLIFVLNNVQVVKCVFKRIYIRVVGGGWCEGNQQRGGRGCTQRHVFRRGSGRERRCEGAWLGSAFCRSILRSDNAETNTSSRSSVIDTNRPTVVYCTKHITKSPVRK